MNCSITCGIAVIILLPPDDPITIAASPLSFRTIIGVIEDCGLLPGTMRLTSDGRKPKPFGGPPGTAKSSISLLKTIPVLEPMTFDPNLQQVQK